MACTVIYTDLYMTLLVFCSLMSTHSILDVVSQASFFPTSFCPDVLIWACATGTPLVSLFLSSQREIEGTPIHSEVGRSVLLIKNNWSLFN